MASCDAALGKVVNSASCFEISIGETASLIADVMNSDISIVSDETRYRPSLSEVNRLFGSNSLLTQLTGWRPMYAGLSGFRKGIELTVDWFTNTDNLSLYRPNRYTI